MTERKKKKNEKKLEFILYYISQLSFSLCEIQENDIYLLGLRGLQKIFDLVLSRDLAILHLQPQAKCWFILLWSRCSKHMNRNEHWAALRIRTMSYIESFRDRQAKSDSQKQMKTKFPTCDIKLLSSNLQVSFARMKEVLWKNQHENSIFFCLYLLTTF